MENKLPPLWAHQTLAIQKAAFLPGYALYFEMGCGKSRAVIEVLRSRFNAEKRVLRTIIFCPPIVVPNWKDEWLRYTKLDPRYLIMLQGSGAKRLKTFQEATADGRGRIIVTNYESLLMKPLYEAFQNWKPEALVFDESHKCKDPKAARSKLADDLANPLEQYREAGKVKYRRLPRPLVYLLSGSPILNNAIDIFQQYKILDGGEAFGYNYFRFRARYFRNRNAGMPNDRYFPKWEIMTMEKDGFDAEGEISRVMASKGMRVEKKDCLDLPPEVSVILKVGMTPEQKRVYDEMKRDFITFMNSKACTATLAITKALRLMQITSGFLAVDNQGEDENCEAKISLGLTPKQQALRELLTELTEQGHKVLVWAVWKENYEQIRNVCKDLKLGYVEVHGGVPGTKKQDAIDRFKADPNCRVFIGHPGSGGIGINLTNAAYSIFYSRTFSLEHYLQARARNHRGGSREAGHDKITHYDLVCEGTIDELAQQKLANKQELSDKLLRELTLELQAK